MNINGTITIDREKGTATVDLALVGHSELDHELLAAFFTVRRVMLSPTHQGDVLGTQFVIEDEDAFEEALHNLENRKRVADGRPTIEEEGERARKATEAQVAAEASQKDRDAKAQAGRDASRDRVERMAAKEIADRTLAAQSSDKPEAPKPQAKEPDKVQ